MRVRIRGWITVGIATLLAACGGAPPSTSNAGQASASSAGTTLIFDDMNDQQRKNFMKAVVLPTMKQEFEKYDANAYADMNCATCHGASAKDGSFGMPNPNLPKLPSDAAGFDELMKQKPRAVKFMSDVVVPAMAKMLSEPAYDPKTQEGFGCFECHTKA